MPEEMGRLGNFIDLPTCELHRLAELAELLTSVRLSRARKERLAQALKSGEYIPKLLEIFQLCEKEKDTKNLHHLYDVVRGILFLDKAALYEVVFSDECFLGVVGCLEYNPCLAQPARYREFLSKVPKLHEAVPLKDPEVKKNVRQAFRAQYIQAIIVPDPSEFEEGFLSTLNSIISSTKEEILHGLLNDEAFLPGIFSRLINEATSVEQRRDLVNFFKEFCAFSFTLSQKRDEFLQTLGKLGFLPTLEKLMAMDDQQVRSTVTDILYYLVDISPATLQDFVLQEARQSENNTQLIIKVIEQMISTPDPEFGGENQLMEIFRLLINTNKMLARVSHLEVFEFLDVFYERYIHVLIGPLLAVTSGEWHEIENYQKAEILATILETLSFCAQRHRYHMKVFIIKKDLLRSALVLMKSKHKFLALSALRFMRKIIGMKDELYNRYVTLGNLFEPVVNAVVQNRNRCNMLKSASMEMFEFILKENIQPLIAHIVENFSDALESVKPAHTFQGLKTKYEQAKKQRKRKLNRVPSILPAETFAKEPIVSSVDEDLKTSGGEEKASPPSSNDSSPLKTVMKAPKRGVFEIFALPDDGEDEAVPEKRACLDS